MRFLVTCVGLGSVALCFTAGMTLREWMPYQVRHDESWVMHTTPRHSREDGNLLTLNVWIPHQVRNDD